MNTGGVQAMTLDGPDKRGRDQQSWVAPVISSWQRRALGAGSLAAFRMCSLQSPESGDTGCIFNSITKGLWLTY